MAAASGRAMSTTQKLRSSLSEAVEAMRQRLDSAGAMHLLDEEEQQQAERLKAIQERSRALWARRGRRYARCTLDNFEVGDHPEKQRVLAALEAYASDLSRNVQRGRGVVLVGPAGTGKDHLLAGLVHCALMRGHTVDWRTGAELWRSLRAAIRDDRENEALAALRQPEILVLSDPVPPETSPSNYERSVLYSVIDERYSRVRATWCSINAADREDAEERLGVAVVDRLTDSALSLACPWESFRAGRRLDL